MKPAQHNGLDRRRRLAPVRDAGREDRGLRVHLGKGEALELLGSRSAGEGLRLTSRVPAGRADIASGRPLARLASAGLCGEGGRQKRGRRIAPTPLKVGPSCGSGGRKRSPLRGGARPDGCMGRVARPSGREHGRGGGGTHTTG